MSRQSRFTIWHGVAASVALHSALALPFVVHNLLPPVELPTLVIELQGVVSDAQAEERAAQPMPDEQPQQQPESTPPPPQQAPPSQPQDEGGTSPPDIQPQPPVPVEPGSSLPPQVLDPDEQQQAQTLKVEREADADRLRDYARHLTRKVQANLVYPNEGRRAGLQGSATVSFTLAGDGQIKPGTLTIAASSGQPRLDASALATVRACAPFEPPPRETTITLVVGYGRRK